MSALSDKVAGVRENAIRIAETRIEKSQPIAQALLQAAKGSGNAQVRFQAALSLGELSSPDVSAALLKIAERDAADPWTRAAILTSLSENPLEFLKLVLNDSALSATPGGADMIEQLSQAMKLPRTSR